MSIDMEVDNSPELPELPDIDGSWRNYMAKQASIIPQNNMRASSIGHPCDRYHWHSVKDWRARPLPDPVLQSIFNEGKFHETAVIQCLQNMGFEIVEQQRAFQIEKPLITGHVDGILRYKDNSFPFDVKTTNPYDFDKLTSAEDFLNSHKTYHRNYIAQLQLYLLMTNNPVGCLIMKNKLTGALRSVFMQIDYAFCENILKRAERVYAALAQNEPAARTENIDHCLQCPFRHLCLPDLAMSPGVQVIDDLELGGLLERRNQLKPMADEFKDTDETIKDFIKPHGAGERICGEWLIQTKEQTKKEYTVKESTFLVTKFARLK